MIAKSIFIFIFTAISVVPKYMYIHTNIQKFSMIVCMYICEDIRYRVLRKVELESRVYPAFLLSGG